MKLKTIVVSLGLIGLVSGTAFAGVIHHEMNPAGKYAPRQSFQLRHHLLNEMTQNESQMMPVANWFRDIRMDGGVQIASSLGNTGINGAGISADPLAVHNAFLNVDAKINSKVMAFVGLHYNSIDKLENNAKNNYGFAYKLDTLYVEQAYITFSHFTRSPFYIRVGKQFLNFGHYRPHALIRPMTQVLSEGLEPAVEVGFISPVGVHGGISVFENSMRKVKSGETGGGDDNPLVVKTTPNVVADIGYLGVYNHIHYHIGGSYMDNMVGVADVANAIETLQDAGDGSYDDQAYHKGVGAIALHAALHYVRGYQGYSLGADYVTATGHFSARDLTTDAQQYDFNDGEPTGRGARPAAWGIHAGYGFYVMNGKHAHFTLSYQRSQDGAVLFLPRYRLQAGFHVALLKDTTLGLIFAHNCNYNRGYILPGEADGDVRSDDVKKNLNGQNYNTLVLSVGVHFG